MTNAIELGDDVLDAVTGGGENCPKPKLRTKNPYAKKTETKDTSTSGS